MSCAPIHPFSNEYCMDSNLTGQPAQAPIKIAVNRGGKLHSNCSSTINYSLDTFETIHACMFLMTELSEAKHYYS